jgi:hypothetical protein
MKKLFLVLALMLAPMIGNARPPQLTTAQLAEVAKKMNASLPMEFATGGGSVDKVVAGPGLRLTVFFNFTEPTTFTPAEIQDAKAEPCNTTVMIRPLLERGVTIAGSYSSEHRHFITIETKPADCGF